MTYEIPGGTEQMGVRAPDGAARQRREKLGGQGSTDQSIPTIPYPLSNKNLISSLRDQVYLRIICCLPFPLIAVGYNSRYAPLRMETNKLSFFPTERVGISTWCFILDTVPMAVCLTPRVCSWSLSPASWQRSRIRFIKNLR